MPRATLPAPARLAEVEVLRANMPTAMTALPQWLVWRLEHVEGRNGLQKVPYYCSGQKRRGDPGGAQDRAGLVGFEKALDRFGSMASMTGLGFAFLAGDGLIGIDLDKIADEDGVIANHFQSILEVCPSYTERSPSGKGLHIIVSGQCDSFKHDPIGVEVYCGGRYFACTGNRVEDTPEQVAPLKPYALAYLRDLVQSSKDRVRAMKEQGTQPPAGEAEPQSAQQATQQAQTPAPAGDERGARRTEPAGQQGNDFKRVNDAAYQQLHSWVPQVFGKARAWKSGYRVRSKDMGRDLEEDLQLTTEGIYDFGEEQGMSPIDVVIKWGAAGSTPKAAMLWLASVLGVQVQNRPRLHAVEGGKARPMAEPPPDDVPLPEHPEDDAGTTAGDGAGGAGGGKRGAKRTRGGVGGGGIVARLLEHYALVRGTDQVWDGEMRSCMAVKNLRLLYGGPFVNMWLGHPERRLLLAEQIKFEPGQDLPEGCVNLFDGLPTEPVECVEDEVEPILELLQHLTSLSAPTPEGVKAVYTQVLRWCALIVQKPGAKVRFALVFHGPQGTGKNLFWDCFRRILGKYGKMVGQTELEDRFNGYMSGKLLLIGNEVVTRAELFHNKNKLKWVITEDEIPIRGMHQEVRWESNHANVVFLSNELQPVALEKDDRRHLVVYTPAAEDPQLYLRVAEFIKNDGCGKFLYYLQRMDLGDFTEFTKPLMTGAKETLIDLGLKPAERFTNEWLQGFLDLPMHPCSNVQLYTAFRRWCEMNGERYPPPQAQFTKTVERHVFEQVERDDEGRKLPPSLVYKQINLRQDGGQVPGDEASGVGGYRKTVRCWVPRGTGPRNGETEGEWAGLCVTEFEAKLSKFGRRAQHEDER